MSENMPLPVSIQTAAELVPAVPPWFGEVTVAAPFLRRLGVLVTIEERVRFARRRFGHYDLIDFVAMLFGYAVSGERTLQAFYERLQPFAPAFMALFGLDRLPSRSALSRFLAALAPEPVEALRTLFLSDLLALGRHRGAAGRALGSTRNPVGDLRCGWHARGGPATRLAPNPGSPAGPAPLASALRAWLPGAQAGRGRAHPHDRVAGAYAPMARHLRQPRQRRVPG